MHVLLDTVEVNKRTVDACGNGQWWCTFNYDTLISTGLAMLITVVVGLWVARRLSDGRPGKLQMIFEGLLGFVQNTLRENVGEDAVEGARVAVPVAATVAFFILVANLIAFLPLFKPFVPANSDLNLTLAMALVVFIVVQWYAWVSTGPKGFFRRFTKPFELPMVARILFIPLNLIEEIAKPITLAVRLLGNIFAGLLMVDLIGQFALLGSGPLRAPIGAVGVVMMIAWKLFDAFIGVIQAFIFMLLTIIYFGMAREGIHGLEEHGHRHAPKPQLGEAT